MKKIVFLAVILLGIGCAKENTSPQVAEVPNYGYKKALEKYQEAEDEKRPSASLWANSSSQGSLFKDYKARRVGDLITIKIVENVKANNSSSASTSKATSYDASISAMMGLPLDLGIKDVAGTGNSFTPTIGAATSNSFAGNGSTVKNDSITGTLTATVIEVLPTGNLLVEGFREIIVDQQKQTVTIKGVVRPRDIDAKNEVPSTSIADAQISYSGDGTITDSTRKGWMATFVDWVWPF